MADIGSLLRETRIRKKIDITTVEHATKIRAKYLRALENEEWSLLPGPTFVKTFLRTYAEVVGLDPHVLVEEYRHSHEHDDDQEVQALAPMPRQQGNRAGRRQPSRPPPRGAVVAAVVVALVGFLLVLGLLGGEDAQDGGSAGTERAATTTTETVPDRERAGERRARAEKPAPRGVRVRVVPAEPTYACVDNGAPTEVVYEGTLEAPQTFTHRRLVRMNLGKRSARITLNGEPIAVADSPDALGLALRPDGSREIPLGERPCS